MTEWLEKLESGDMTGLRVVYGVFATDDAELIQRAGAAVSGQLEKLQRSQLLKLCEQFRDFTSLEWSIDWAKVNVNHIKAALPEETYRYVLILGSFHPNGYFREKCISEMAEYDGMLFWLFFRVNDWVWNIRAKACEILEDYLENVGVEELFDSMPAFERLWNCRRRSEEQMRKLWDQIEKRLSLALKDLDISELPRMEPFVRKALYRVLVQSGFLTLGDMDSILIREKIPCLKRILMRGILARPECTVAWAERYLADSSAVIRRMAVEFRYEHLKSDWQGLEDMLLDSSRGVREYAVYILRRHGRLDVRGYYLGHLGDDKPEYAIMGLAESESRGNLQELMNCLERPDRKVLKYTLLALGYQEDFTDEELLWRYLLDCRIDISKAAYLSIKRKNFQPEEQRLYEAYMEAEAEHHRRYLLNLLLRGSSWRRFPFLIRIYCGDLSAEESRRVLSGIRNRSMYGRITQSLYRDILLALEENGKELPEGVEEGIRYDMRFLVK